MTTSTQDRATTGKLLALAVLVAVLVASLMLGAEPSYAATTFYVNSTGDDGDQTPGNGECYTGIDVAAQEKECTLRAAIQEANAFAGPDTINFDIPGSGVHTIAPATELPAIAKPTTVNGYSQPGAEPNQKAVGSDAVLKIELSRASCSDCDGLEIGAANSTVKGLVINRWDAGIWIDGPDATGNKVVGNFIGTDKTGTQKLGNSVGVRVYHGSNNTIGGTTPAERNVISGNTYSGVSLGDGVIIESNRVIGNYIGTDKTGMQELGNGYYGVNIDDAPGNTIGGTTASERNVISGNDKSGVSIFARGTRVMGNYVGTDASGTKDLGNGDNGVYIGDANNSVGGSTAGARNVISGNNGEGVLINGTDATGNRVVGNYLGSDASGTRDLGNSLDGVFVYEASNNAIGGTQAGERNVILGNGYDGVAIYGNGATGNRLLSNSISSNDEQGIDLNADGPTANDPDDPDAGSNGLQNKPVLSSARKSATGTTTVRGTLNSTPGKTFTVQFFSNPEGTDEGKTLLSSAMVKTNETGNVSFAFSTKKTVRQGQNITATATNTSTGNTSEFSAPRKVVAQ